MRKIVALLFILVPASQNVSAADWQVMQTASIASPTFSMTQGSTTSSRQAVNASVLGSQVVNPAGDIIAQGDSLTSVKQTVTFTGTDVTLTQDGSATNSNVQTVNLASAPSILQLEQIVEDFDTATLTQDVTDGNDNVQALNYAAAEGTINDAKQTVTGVSITLTKTATTPDENIQAVNYMKANRYSGDITQVVKLSGMLSAQDLSASSTGTRTGIRINSINGDTAGVVSSLEQTVKVRGIQVEGSDLPTIIINHVGP